MLRLAFLLNGYVDKIRKKVPWLPVTGACMDKLVCPYSKSFYQIFGINPLSGLNMHHIVKFRVYRVVK